MHAGGDIHRTNGKVFELARKRANPRRNPDATGDGQHALQGAGCSPCRLRSLLKRGLLRTKRRRRLGGGLCGLRGGLRRLGNGLGNAFVGTRGLGRGLRILLHRLNETALGTGGLRGRLRLGRNRRVQCGGGLRKLGSALLPLRLHRAGLGTGLIQLLEALEDVRNGLIELGDIHSQAGQDITDQNL